MIKHLHGRGEDTPSPFAPKSLTETPPRTWRRLRAENVPASRCRNTSTDVEKTDTDSGLLWLVKKHLHGRGEDSTIVGRENRTLETPPRTWRRLVALGRFCRRHGNTSTDVEKTLS